MGDIVMNHLMSFNPPRTGGVPRCRTHRTAENLVPLTIDCIADDLVDSVKSANIDDSEIDSKYRFLV